MRRRRPVLAVAPGRGVRSLALRGLLFVSAWALVTVPVSVVIFLHSSSNTVIASHDAVVRPALDGYATVDLGPYLPNLRYPAATRLGASIDVGKTNADSYETLVERYAIIASQPEGQVTKLRGAVIDMAWDAAISGGLIGLAAPGLWVVLGPRRRTELLRHVTRRRLGVLGLAGAVVAVATLQPWARLGEDFTQGVSWQPVGEALPDVSVPEVARPIEVQQGLMTSGTKRLAESALSTLATSREFYNEVAEAARTVPLDLHEPAEDETVALLVSDRHDNVGMDAVARAIADRGGATVLLNAGDDTSTGGEWEAFSLESLDVAFDDFDDRYSVAGNHDHGTFVTDYFDELGFTTLEGEAVDGPGDTRLLGVSDPRSSGLGAWRDEPGLSFHEHEQRVADLVCEHHEDGDRMSTLLVHDANTGRQALDRGCVDLVLGGHVHAQLGPIQVVGENGEIGYTFTNGTTGGAVYALAIGSKLRRNAQVTLVTYRDGRPVGIQPVTVRTVGDFLVGEYHELDLDRPETETVPTQDS